MISWILGRLGVNTQSPILFIKKNSSQEFSLKNQKIIRDSIFMRCTLWGTQVESSMCLISYAHFHSKTCLFTHDRHILLTHYCIMPFPPEKLIMHLRAQPSNDHHLRNWICIGMYNNNNNNNKKQTLNTQQKMQSFKLMMLLQIINPVKENHSQHSKSSQAGPIYPFMWYMPITDFFTWSKSKKNCQHHLSTRFS